MNKTTEIGKQFLEGYDRYIKDNIESIRCIELNDIYWEISRKLKNLTLQITIPLWT